MNRRSFFTSVAALPVAAAAAAAGIAAIAKKPAGLAEFRMAPGYPPQVGERVFTGMPTGLQISARYDEPITISTGASSITHLNTSLPPKASSSVIGALSSRIA